MRIISPKIINSEISATAVEPKQFPSDGLPEFVFVGRSNVGKSSLINAMTNRKSLARTSSAPGKTRAINFFKVSVLLGNTAEKALPTELYFVDLPGYGYAKVSRAESQKWGAMIEGYLKNRQQIKYIIMLLDIRHEPSAKDMELFEWLNHYGYNTIVVATKSDKLKRAQVQKHMAMLRRALGVEALPFSSETRSGWEQLWERICKECYSSQL